MFGITLQPVNAWLLIAVLLGCGWMAVHTYRRAGWKLALLRAVVLLLLVFILFQPSRTHYRKSSDKPLVAYLVDTSMSMKIADPVERYSAVKKFFDSNKGSGSSRISDRLWKHKKVVFTFSESSQRTTIENVAGANPEGAQTDIGLALEQVKKELLGNRLSGIILLSDGGDNMGSGAIGTAANLGVPVYTIGVGNPQKYFDLRVDAVMASEFAFKNSPVNIDVTVSGAGYNGKSVPVMLKGEEGMIQTRRVMFEEGSETKKLEFTFTPRRVGNFSYSVEIPGYNAEVTLKNNVKRFSMQVIRDKIRIMYICGQPSWEYSFIRNSLKNDPTVDFISFNILRNPEDVTIVSDSELALIPFPIHDIFTKDIYGFDLMIFENFRASRFNISRPYMENVKKFVMENGGAFLMIGGDNSFGKGGYKNTPLGEILPVEMSGNAEKVLQGTFRMRVTNYAHPIVQLSNDPVENRKLWDSMPKLDGCNELLKAKPGAVCLGVHPMKKNEHGNLPVLCAWEKGKGRVMSVASNTTWRWSFQLAAEGKGNFYYNRFWSQAVRWLIQADDMNLVHLSADRGKYMKDEEIKLNIRVFDRYYRPNDNVAVYLSVESPNGNKIDLGMAPPIPGIEGQYETGYKGAMEGRYRFKAEAYKDGKKLGVDELVCEVAVPSREYDNPKLNVSLLEEIAKASGGKYFHISSVKEQEIEFPSEREMVMMTSRKSTLWNNVLLLILILALLSSEWYIRRKSGLL